MALNTINLPFSEADVDENGIKYITSVLPEVFHAGDCRMRDGAILTLRYNGTLSFFASLRTDAGSGDVWHQRFEVFDARGQFLFRLPDEINPFTHQPKWWNQDFSGFAPIEDYPYKMVVAFNFPFNAEQWNRISFVTWFGDC